MAGYCFAIGEVPLMVKPMLRAVPATILMADSIVKQLRSFILSSAITLTCSQDTDPTLVRLDSAEPLLIFDASINCTATGGRLIIKSKLLSL